MGVSTDFKELATILSINQSTSQPFDPISSHMTLLSQCSSFDTDIDLNIYKILLL